MNKDTLGGRFAEFRAGSKANAVKYGRISEWSKKYKADLNFFKEELERLAVEMESYKIPVKKGSVSPEEYENIIGNNAALATAVFIIRSRKNEL